MLRNREFSQFASTVFRWLIQRMRLKELYRRSISIWTFKDDGRDMVAVVSKLLGEGRCCPIFDTAGNPLPQLERSLNPCMVVLEYDCKLDIVISTCNERETYPGSAMRVGEDAKLKSTISRSNKRKCKV